MEFEKALDAFKKDKRNLAFVKEGWEPVLKVDKEARILLIGQAPGRKAQEAGKVFQDESGKRLRDWLGVDEETFLSPSFAVLPMDFYYPGKGRSGDLPPRPFVAEEYHPLFLEEMKKVALTIYLGKYSLSYYLKEKSLTEALRKDPDLLPSRFVLPHPSPLNFRYLAKNPWVEKDLVPLLRKRVKEILAR